MTSSSSKRSKKFVAPIYSDIEVICDRSGSMETFGTAIKNQMFQLIMDQREMAREKDLNSFMSFTTFDTNATTYIDNQSLSSLEYISAETIHKWTEPRDLTRLNDTIAERIDLQTKRLEEYKNRLSKEVWDLNPTIISTLYVLTDGMDNKSNTFSDIKLLREKVLKARKNGLKTILLAANQNAQDLAERYGFDKDLALTIGRDPTTSSIGMGYTNDMMKRIVSGEAPPDLQFNGVMRSVSCPESDPNHPNNYSTTPLPPIGLLSRQTNHYMGTAINDDDDILNQPYIGPLLGGGGPMPYSYNSGGGPMPLS